jgi:ATP-dependent helicase/nuclease subunit B
LDLFAQIVADTALPIEDQPHRGVQVMDAMTARGVSFRALFVIGLNDHVFPRTVREDPFLRDRHRTLLESTLGYKIDDKLSGHDEERLLFELLIGSATQRLCLSYQRADDAGRVMAPSAFLAQAVRDHRFVATPEETIPRRLTTRIHCQPAIQELLPAQDLMLGRLLHGNEALSLCDALGHNRHLLEHGLAALNAIERTSTELGPFDGLLTPGNPVHSRLEEEGVSPTSLERYATCPFQYFAEKILRLDPIRQNPESGLPALTMGSLVHESLRHTYERLVALRWPDTPVVESELRTTVTAAVSQAFASHAATGGTGHALLWAIAREQVVDLVFNVTVLDQEDYCKSGFRPHAFETTVEGTLRLQETPARSLKVRGKLDRVDVRSNPPATRIVDYKFKQGSEMATIDRKLKTAAVRGWRLQAPFYASMDVPGCPPASDVQFLYLGPRWDQPIVRATFESSALDQPLGASIRQTIGTLLGGITRGEFFILPDGYCEHCAFPSACRRHDSLIWWRSYRSPHTRVLRQLRKQKVQDDE